MNAKTKHPADRGVLFVWVRSVGTSHRAARFYLMSNIQI